MQNTKLILLLKTFSREELKRFGDFVQSPYFNKREAPINLYKILVPLYPDFENLKWEKIFKKAFPNKPAYNEAYLRNVLSDLYELALGFFRQDVAEKNQTEGEFTCVSKLIYRQLFKQAEQHLEQIREWIEKSRLENDDNALWAEYYTYKMILYDRSEERQAYSEAHQQKVNHWEKAIWEKIISLIYETETDKKTYHNFSYQTESLKKLLTLFEVEKYADTPTILATYYCALLTTNPNWETFDKLHLLLQTQKEAMLDRQVYSSYQALLAYISRLMRHSLHNGELVPLQMKLLQNSVDLREKNKLHLNESHYISIACNGYDLYGSDWAKQYIDDNASKLLPYLQEPLPIYCKAAVCFNEKKYTEALYLFASLPNFRSEVYFSIKPYMLMCYYEIGDNDAADLLFDTLKKTFKNHPDLSVGSKEALHNFILLYGQFIKLHLQGCDLDSIALLKKSIESPDAPLFAKQWFWEKVNTLEVKKRQVNHILAQ